MFVLVVGGGKVGYYLTRELIQSNHEVVLMEKDRVRANQIAAEVFDAKRVIAKINDPLRAQAYAELGIATICRTELMADAVLSYVSLPPTGESGVRAPAGAHPGADHPPVLGAVGEAASDGSAQRAGVEG